MKRYLFILLLFSLKSLYCQKIEINYLLDEILCVQGYNYQFQKIFVINEENPIFGFNDSLKPKCVDVIICKNEKKFVKYFRKNSGLLLAYIHPMQRADTTINFKKFILRISLATKKSYGSPGKDHALVNQAEFYIFVKKNYLTGFWEVDKIGILSQAGAH